MPVQSKSLSCDLRPGHIAAMYYTEILETEIPSQLSVLSDLYPGLLIENIPSDGNTKQDAVFDDASGMIRAVVYHGKLYAGSSSRVSQITARLMGTARSGIEKERRTAADIQIRITKMFAEDPDCLIGFWNMYLTRMESWPEETLLRAAGSIASFAIHLQEEFRGDGLFPMDAEVSSELMTRIIDRLLDESMEGLVDAWVWILLGALLRNEIRRLLFRYRADFSLSSDDSPSYDPDDQYNADDGFEYVYEGDDMEKRFPGIEWYCDRCGERLDHQEGFNDFVHVWKCTNCGFRNRIETDVIYDTEEDYRKGKDPIDRQKFFDALKTRTDELDD